MGVIYRILKNQSMNFKKILFYQLLLTVVFLPITLSAQADKQAVKSQFSCVSWNKLSMAELFFRNGKKFMPLRVKAKNRSELYPLGKSQALEVYVKAEEGEEEEYRMVGKASIPENSGRVLFLIAEVKSPKNASDLPLRISGIDDGLKTFPPGSFRFMNNTRAPLTVIFDKQKKNIPPRKMSVIKFKASSDGGLIPFYIRGPKGEDLYENRLFGRPTGRDMLFIGNPTRKGGRLNILLLPQIVAPRLRASQ